MDSAGRDVFLDLFAGCQSTKRAALAAGYRYVSVDLLPVFKKAGAEVRTAVVADLRRHSPDSLLKLVCSVAGIAMGAIAFIWASPPCRTMSYASTTKLHRDRRPEEWVSKGRAKGLVTGARQPKTVAAVQDDGLATLATWVLLLCWQGHRIPSAIENPYASLQLRPYMNSHYALTSWLKLLASQNMQPILVTLDTSQPPTSWLKLLAP